MIAARYGCEPLTHARARLPYEQFRASALPIKSKLKLLNRLFRLHLSNNMQPPKEPLPIETRAQSIIIYSIDLCYKSSQIQQFKAEIPNINTRR